MSPGDQDLTPCLSHAHIIPMSHKDFRKRGTKSLGLEYGVLDFSLRCAPISQMGNVRPEKEGDLAVLKQ